MGRIQIHKEKNNTFVALMCVLKQNFTKAYVDVHLTLNFMSN